MATLDPASVEARAAIADLCIDVGELDKALEHHRSLLLLQPQRIESYRVLFAIYLRSERFDEAWCIAAVLTFLQSAAPKEEKFYRDYRGIQPPEPTRRLQPGHWHMLRHPDEDMVISQMMGLLATHLRDEYALERRDWGLHWRKDLLDVNQPLLFSKIYHRTAQILELSPIPQVYVKRDQRAPICNANLEHPSSIVGPSLLQNDSEWETSFLVGRHLCLMRLEYYMASGIFTLEQLMAFFLAGMQASRPDLQLSDDPMFHNMVRLVSGLSGHVLQELGGYVQEIFSREINTDLATWQAAVDYTSARVGLLFGSDPCEAAIGLQKDTTEIGPRPAKEKLKDLLLFSISEEYFQLRQQLGLTVIRNTSQ